MINGKTLILRFSSLGDVVMAVPVIRSLETKYPENKFIFVTRTKFKPFFSEFNNIEILKNGIQKNIGDLTIKTHDAGFPYNYLWTFSFEIIQGGKVLYFESHVDKPSRIKTK